MLMLGNVPLGKGLLAMIVFILLIVVWSVASKRNIGEAMFVGMIVVALFGTTEAPTLLYEGVKYALNYNVLYTSLVFVFMSVLLQNSNVLEGLLKILNRLFGRFKGGPAYVNTGISAILGCLSGGNSPNAATSGSFTAQWLMETGWTKEGAATLIAGNGGLGAGFPPSSSLFIVLGFPTVAGIVTGGRLYLALFISGLYQIVHRIAYIHYYTKKHNIQPMVRDTSIPLKQVLKENGKSALIFLGAIIPILVTMGPIGNSFISRSDLWAEAMDSINILVWIPTLMIAIILLLDGKGIKEKFGNVQNFIDALIPQFKSIGGLLLFVFAASNIISSLGLGEDVARVLEVVNLNKPLTIVIILTLITIVAGPLSSTATLTSIGVISHAILVNVGVDPLLAAVAILVVASAEGASPPASGALYIACGLTGAEPPKIFKPLIVLFVIPITVLAIILAFGLLPV